MGSDPALGLKPTVKEGDSGTSKMDFLALVIDPRRPEDKLASRQDASKRALPLHACASDLLKHSPLHAQEIG